MALKKCKECGGEISSRAESCPHCGSPIQCTRRRLGRLGGIGGLLFLGFILYPVLAGFMPGRDGKVTEAPGEKKGITNGIDWTGRAEHLLAQFKSEITEVRKLNSTTCWVALDGRVPTGQAEKTAEDVGAYLKNTYGATPNIRVFKGGTHLAVARFNEAEETYVGEADIEEWTR